MPTTPATAGRRWWALGREGWRVVLGRTIQAFKADEVGNLASVVTLRLVLAVVPSLIAVVAIAAQVVSTDDIQRLVASSEGLVPGSAQGFVQSSLATAIDNLRDNGTVALVGSVLVGVFAASGAATALITALNRAYGVQEGRGLVGQRLVSLVVVGALVIALAALFVAIVLGPTLLEWLLPSAMLTGPVRLGITLGRYAAAVVVLILFFGFAFWVAPDRDRPPLRFLTPGAVFGVVGWLLLSWLFGLYIAVAGNYSATYGAFAGVIVLLVWMKYSFSVLLTGAELDNEIARHLDEGQTLDEVVDPSVRLTGP